MHKRPWKTIRVILVVLGCVFLGSMGVLCIAPQPFPGTYKPRPGRVLGSKVAVVFSYHYQMNMGGFERKHPYPQKWGRIYTELLQKGYLSSRDVFVPEEVTREQILLVHSEQFLKNLKDSRNVAQYLEIPALAVAPGGLVDAGVLGPFRRQAGGTLLAGREALKHGIGINIGGGYHHAMRDYGEGFNIYADIAIAIRVLQKEGLIQRALVVDLDVHQGNGTAELFAGDQSVFTFSMHEGDIYPIPKAQSDLDIELPAGTDDSEYLRLLGKALPRIFAQARPDIVFIQGGADVLGGDPLANLRLSPRGLVRRDAMVIDECVRRGIPVVTTVGGGYGPKGWRAQYESICRTIRKYGTQDGRAIYPRRKPTHKERLYAK